MKRVLAGIFYLLIFTTVIYAQTKVTGKVIDTQGEPILGVNVFISGTTTGTITDASGHFSLNVDDVNNSILVFSFIGFENQNIKLNGKTELNITLKEEVSDLEEVTIYSYGKIKKSDLTGSVSSITLETNNGANTTLDQMLQGRAGGVMVSTASAEPGANVNVRIRGLNSISVSNQPLYVIDGIPMDVDNNTPDAMGSPINKSYSPLIGINPNDIESVEVLKDASATAIYGSRGANGVVLITTKGGKKRGNSELTFSSSVTVSKTSETIDVLRTQEYAEYENEYRMVAARLNNHKKKNPWQRAIPTISYDGIKAPMPSELEGYFWQDEVLRTSISQDYNLSLTGSSESANYYLAFGTSLAQGIVKNSSLNRYNFSGKYNWDVTNKLRYNLTVGFTHAEGKGTSTSGDTENVSYSAINWMLTKAPIAGKYTTDDDVMLDPEEIDIPNPLMFVNDYVSEPKSNYFRGKISMEYDLTKWALLDFRYGLNYVKNIRAQYWPRTLPMSRDRGRAGYSTSDQLNYTFNALIHLDHKFNKIHKINFTAGIELNNKNNQTFKIRGDGFPDDELYYYNLESAMQFSPADLDRIKSNMFSYIARLNYTYKNKYLLTATGRYDGSSKFSVEDKYAFFPSVSVAWRVTEEDFMKNNEFMNNLKIRFSWGQAGNQGLPPYSTLSAYYATIYPLNGTPQAGYSLYDFAKPLRWETSEQLNLGVDLGFFNSRILLTVDIYKKQNKDALIRRNIPLSSGSATAWDNMGQVNNKGIDFEAQFRIIDSKLKWDLGGNLSIYRNEIAKLGLPESSYGYVQFWGQKISGFQEPVNTYIEGQPIGQFWGYITDGLFQTQEEIDNLNQEAQDKAGQDLYQFGLNVSPGDIKYVDVNNDGIVNELDKTVIGNPNPDFTYGISNSLTYKHFNLNLFFTGVQGVDVFNANLLSLTNVSKGNSNIIAEAYRDAWRGEGTSNYWPRITNDKVVNRLHPSDRLVEDGSYFRLQNATLSYNTGIKRVQWISNINFSVTGVNLFTLTKYSWWNPEASAFGNNNMAMGIDRNSYPMARSIVFGLSVSFK